MSLLEHLVLRVSKILSSLYKGLRRGIRTLTVVAGISDSSNTAPVTVKSESGIDSHKGEGSAHTVRSAANTDKEVGICAKSDIGSDSSIDMPQQNITSMNGPWSKVADDDDQIEQLPKCVVPHHYQIELIPGIEDKVGGHKFEGLVHIDISVQDTTNEIVLNASSLTIEKIDLIPYTTGNDGICVNNWLTDLEKERLKITLSGYLLPGTKWKLSIKYTGVHGDNMAGFYRVAIHNNDQKKYMFSTQFESRHCCKAIPCWDEPGVKCTFSVTLKVPNSMVALSNMSVMEDKVDELHDDALKVVKYKTTPKMSTYLLAFVIGELKYLEAYTESKPLSEGNSTRPIKCRVYSTPEHIESGAFALDIACRVLEFFEEYFDFAYPLDKLDQVAIADFSAGAMENWGLVTYREAALLFDPSKSSSRFKLRVATTVAHELAHQWFGNLVTMGWWNDLWLNEGFATFASALVLSKLYPSWEPFVEFVNGDHSSALIMDGLATTHPIDVPIHKALEIDQIFDSICYSKGASIINMVHSYLGYDEFRKSLQYYIKTYQYSNTKSVDIWKAFDSVTNLNLASNMYNWIKTPGYPLVTVDKESYDAEKGVVTLSLKQKRYFSSGIPSEKDTDVTWWIPMVVVAGCDVKSKQFKFEFDTKDVEISFPYVKTENSYWKLNAGTSGLYRVCMKEEQILSICSVLRNNLSAITTQDKLGILSDSFAVAKSGEGSFTSALNIIKALKGETNFFVISLIVQILSSLTHVMYLRPESTVKAIKNFTKYMFSDSVKDVGYDTKPGDDTLDSLKRSILVSALANAGDEQVLTELRTRFELYINGDENSLCPDIRDATYSTILKFSSNPEKDLETMLNLYKNVKTPDQSIVLISSFGAVNSDTLAYDLIHKYSFDSNFIRPQDTIYLYRSLSSKNPNTKYANSILWEFITNNWDKFCKQYSSSVSLLGAIFTSPIDSQIGQDVLDQVNDWVRGKDLEKNSEFVTLLEKRSRSLSIIKRDVEQSIEAIQIRTKWVKRDHQEIETWLHNEGFLET